MPQLNTLPQVRVDIRVRSIESGEECMMTITDNQPVDARLMRASGYEVAEHYETARKRSAERRRLDPDYEPQMVRSSSMMLRVG